MRRRYPYCRGARRHWCKVCRGFRFVRLMMQRDAHCCLTCGAKTTGIEEVTHGDQYTAIILSERRLSLTRRQLARLVSS